MKVTIDQKTEGMFGKKYRVYCHIQLTPEERAALDKRKLWKEVLFEYEHEDPKVQRVQDLFRITIKQFTNNFSEYFITQAGALNFQNRLKNEWLPQLKGAIELGNAPQGPESFEM